MRNSRGGYETTQLVKSRIQRGRHDYTRCILGVSVFWASHILLDRMGVLVALSSGMG
jgi:hypothetical protein